MSFWDDYFGYFNNNDIIEGKQTIVAKKHS